MKRLDIVGLPSGQIITITDDQLKELIKNMVVWKITRYLTTSLDDGVYCFNDDDVEFITRKLSMMLYDQAFKKDSYESGTFMRYLQKIYPDSSSWNNIITLTCSSQDLNNLEGIENLKNLEVLHCDHNNIEELNIGGLSKLRILYCNGNKLTMIKDISRLKNLTILWYEDNDFNEHYLKFLDRYCKIRKIRTIHRKK